MTTSTSVIFVKLSSERVLKVYRKNQTFRGAEPSWANACVGENGAPSYVEYARGFSKAANILIKAVLEDRSIHYTTDEFVYPICFNMRHSIELRLKGAITALQKLAALKEQCLLFNIKDTHDLNKLWLFFKKESISIDDRFHSIVTELNQTIMDIAEVDPTGQTFRYPFNTKSLKHLADVSLINFTVLLRNFTDLEKSLDKLLAVYEWLIEEYNHSGLRKIQRNVIYAIAHDLPNRAHWKNKDFNDTKIRIREKYSLSSNQLTKVINYIQENHALSKLVGIEKPLLGIQPDQIELFVRIWISENEDLKHMPPPYENEDDCYTFSTELAELFRRPRVDWSLLQHLETPEATAGLHALFYFAYDFKFSESYIKTYDRFLVELTVIGRREASALRAELRHIFDKSNFAHHLIQSLFMLGHSSLAEKIIAEHGIEHAFAWLCDARSGALFEHPEFAQYPRQ